MKKSKFAVLEVGAKNLQNCKFLLFKELLLFENFTNLEIFKENKNFRKNKMKKKFL